MNCNVARNNKPATCSKLFMRGFIHHRLVFHNLGESCLNMGKVSLATAIKDGVYLQYPLKSQNSARVDIIFAYLYFIILY